MEAGDRVWTVKVHFKTRIEAEAFIQETMSSGQDPGFLYVEMGLHDDEVKDADS